VVKSSRRREGNKERNGRGRREGGIELNVGPQGLTEMTHYKTVFWILVFHVIAFADNALTYF